MYNTYLLTNKKCANLGFEKLFFSHIYLPFIVSVFSFIAVQAHFVSFIQSQTYVFNE